MVDSTGPSDSHAERPEFEPGHAAKVDPPVATNSWARRTILTRAQEIGLQPELARQVGSVGLWYYNRILLRLKRKEATDRELPPNTNRYLVPIALGMACEYKNHHVELDRLVRLSGNPTKKTIENAYELYARYALLLSPTLAAGRTPKGGRSSPVRRTRGSLAPSAPGVFQVTSPVISRPPPPTGAPKVASARVAPPAPTSGPTTALAIQPPEEVLRIRSLVGNPTPIPNDAKPPPKLRQPNTNAWARKRIAELCRARGLPDRVKRRALGFYDNIVDLHSGRESAPPGKRLQLSPRLNWSLVYTTIYLGCRVEEYPKDLRDILGANPRQGSLREMYRLYRFYKRELNLQITMVDVKTFIHSWIDGFELRELMHEKAEEGEIIWLRNRAIAIANRARGGASLRSTSTKLIAAGALSTALVERHPPRNLSAFYKALANFLHMSEESIRLVVTRIAGIL